MRLLLPILLILLAASCKTRYVTKEVPVVVEHTTERNHTEWRTDTLFHKDSVFVYQQGDTLREVRYVERWRYRDRVVADTVRDTIPAITTIKTVEVREVNVEAPLTSWQKFRLNAFWWLLGACAVGAVVAYRKPLFTLIRRFI